MSLGTNQLPLELNYSKCSKFSPSPLEWSVLVFMTPKQWKMLSALVQVLLKFYYSTVHPIFRQALVRSKGRVSKSFQESFGA
jgi:hypothetical protein